MANGAARVPQDPLDSPPKQVQLDPRVEMVQLVEAEPPAKRPPQEQVAREEILAARVPLEAQVL